MNINELAASKIKQLRNRMGLTSEAMANDLGISKTAFSQLENAKVEITLSRIEAIANFYAVPMAELIPSAGSNTNHHQGIGDNFNTHNNTVNKFFDAKEERMQVLLSELQELLNKK